jgi:DNA adenine methylase
MRQHVISPSNEMRLPPPLKWAGGKRWLVPHLLPHWQQAAARRLVEPFAGGLAVTLGLAPKHALLNDRNPHLIAFYRALQRGLHLDPARVRFENDREVYMRNRALFNELISSGDRESNESAALFYYLNRTCYNGLCRFNAHGRFNVPFGRYKSIPYRYDFTEYAAALRGYEFTNSDFAALPVRAGDFIYADPPYDVEFTSYSAGGFGWDDQVRLAAWLAAHKGPVIASNQATARIVELYRSHGFDVHTLPAPRRISCNGDRTDALEMLAFK